MKLKEWLIQNSIPRKTLAAGIGVSISTINNYLNGNVDLSWVVCDRIAEYTEGDVSAEELRMSHKEMCPCCGHMIYKKSKLKGKIE